MVCGSSSDFYYMSFSTDRVRLAGQGFDEDLPLLPRLLEKGL